ncbi:hypothetical protein TARUN_10184, partial [Trichoderma arundinaceum]
AIQAGGFGRSAMRQIEHLASLPPLNATTMALDTVTKEFQTSPESLAIFAKISGSKVDAFRSNEEWYTRQGYKDMARLDNSYKWADPVTGVEIPVPCVFLKKDLSLSA